VLFLSTNTFLFIDNLCKDSVSNLGYIALNAWKIVNSELEGCGRK
jgi:hypothetical protein